MAINHLIRINNQYADYCQIYFFSDIALVKIRLDFMMMLKPEKLAEFVFIMMMIADIVLKPEKNIN